MASQQQIAVPAVQLIGDIDHPDFRDAVDVLRADARLVTTVNEHPELIVVAQSRPGSIGGQCLETLRRSSPLAGIVALAGTWCEGETRTGRPWPGVQRLYWYEFSVWWQRQLALRAAGRCPDWSRPDDPRYRTEFSNPPRSEPGRPRPRRGPILLHTSHRETAHALADTLRRIGHATAWQQTGRTTPTIRGAIAGIWEGGQLSDREADDLSQFCRRLSAEAAPIVALLDFPRRDRVERAIELGAAAVLGKPWLNADLVATLQAVVESKKHSFAA